jgi:hypothetical protein
MQPPFYWRRMSILPEESTVSTRGVSLIVNKIYATTILLEDNEDIREKSWKKSLEKTAMF